LKELSKVALQKSIICWFSFLGSIINSLLVACQPEFSFNDIPLQGVCQGKILHCKKSPSKRVVIYLI
jgi:hypothetical protein